MLSKDGYSILHASYKKGVLTSVATCAAIVLHWKSIRDQQVIADARAAGLPIMVITANLVEAYSTADPLADLYLEKPASDEDVAALLIDMISAEQDPGADAVNHWRMELAA
jgi:hypothetical protein